MIVYFSGTGNCKYVAERISAALNDTAFSIEKTGTEHLYQTERVLWYRYAHILVGTAAYYERVA